MAFYLHYRYVLYCMKYIDMLLKYKIKPILVFDGRRLPAKEHTEIKRRQYVRIGESFKYYEFKKRL